MPTVVVKTIVKFTCNVCGHAWNSWSEADCCEKQDTASFKYEVGATFCAQIPDIGSDACVWKIVGRRVVLDPSSRHTCVYDLANVQFPSRKLSDFPEKEITASLERS